MPPDQLAPNSSDQLFYKLNLHSTSLRWKEASQIDRNEAWVTPPPMPGRSWRTLPREQPLPHGAECLVIGRRLEGEFQGVPDGVVRLITEAVIPSEIAPLTRIVRC